MQYKRTRLGELLLKKGLIDREQLNSALAFQRQWGHRLGTAMVSLGFISEEELVEVLGEALNIGTIDLSKVEVSQDALNFLPYQVALENDLIPIDIHDPGAGRKKTLTVAVADPLNVAALDEIEFTYDCKVKPLVAPLSMINSAIRKYYLKEDTNITPPPPVKARRPGHADEDGKMTILRAGQYEDIYDQEPTEPTSPGNDTEKIGRPKAFGVKMSDLERMERLQKYVYALLRLLVAKGIITKEEFFNELGKN